MKLKSAWLITWDWIGDHASVDDWLIAIFPRQSSSQTVKEFIERTYVSAVGSPAEKLAYAKKQDKLPRAQHNQIEGVFIDWQICCGDNPFIYARIVDNLRIEFLEELEERLYWEERPAPELPEPLRRQLEQ